MSPLVVDGVQISGLLMRRSRLRVDVFWMEMMTDPAGLLWWWWSVAVLVATVQGVVVVVMVHV